MANEYHAQLLKLRSSILFTMDAMPKDRKDGDGEYLKTVLDNIMLMIDRSIL